MLKAWFAAVATLAVAMALIAVSCDTKVDLGVDPDSAAADAADAGAGT
jgi:hypothetical protein